MVLKKWLFNVFLKKVVCGGIELRAALIAGRPTFHFIPKIFECQTHYTTPR